MARVTATEVKAIMDGVTLADSIVDSYIISANTLVNSALGTAETDLLKEIERWTTAHLIAITRERQAVKEGAGGASIEYAGKFGEGLKSTSFGQTVLVLDTSGKMAALGGKSAEIYAVKSFS